jgi:predicted NBD/HSP70 family sugar kinase
MDEVIPGAVRLDVRLSLDDRTRIVREAVRRRLTVSAYVRQTLLGRLDYEQDRDGHAIAAAARETDARARALVEIVVEAIRNALETLGRTVTDEETKVEQQRLLRWYASAVEDHLRDGRGT